MIASDLTSPELCGGSLSQESLSSGSLVKAWTFYPSFFFFGNFRIASGNVQFIHENGEGRRVKEWYTSTSINTYMVSSHPISSHITSHHIISYQSPMSVQLALIREAFTLGYGTQLNPNTTTTKLRSAKENPAPTCLLPAHCYPDLKPKKPKPYPKSVFEDTLH